MEQIHFALVLALYYAMHSILALNFVKTKVQEVFPLFFKYYRIFFNTIAVLSLFFLVFFYIEMEKNALFSSNLTVQALGSVLFGFGMYVGLAAFRGYDKAEFFGYDAFESQPQKPSVLQTSGWNARVRHPLYFATLLMMWSAVLLFNTTIMLVAALVTTAYLYIGSVLEERKLVQLFGKDYRLYQRSVPMLIPCFNW